MWCFPGYSHRLAAAIFIENFLRFAPLSILHFKLHYLKNAQRLFHAGRSTRLRNFHPVLASAAPAFLMRF
jgi:hypothetical protein